MGLKIKTIALANGDIYEDCIVGKSRGKFLELIKEREFINIRSGKHEILINSEFIVSIEL